MKNIIRLLLVLCIIVIATLFGCKDDKIEIIPADPIDTLPGSWLRMDDIPIGVTELPLVAKGSKIYAAGGMVDEIASNNFMCYDRISDTWELLPDMPKDLDHHSTAIVEDTLYVIGGGGINGLHTEKNVYGYCFTTRVWSIKAALPITISAGAAVAYENKIYLFGGTSVFGVNGERYYFPNVLRYDPQLNIWDTVAAYPNTREHITCLLIEDLIYIIGGRTYDYDNGFETSDLVESFSPQTGQWNTVTNMPIFSSGVSASNIGNKIYFIGGEDLGKITVVDLHHEYDLETGVWKSIKRIPKNRHGVNAVTINDEVHILGGGPIVALGIATKSHYVLTID